MLKVNELLLPLSTLMYFATGTFFFSLSLTFTGDWTQGLEHARQMLSYWAKCLQSKYRAILQSWTRSPIQISQLTNVFIEDQKKKGLGGQTTKARMVLNFCDGTPCWDFCPLAPVYDSALDKRGNFTTEYLRSFNWRVLVSLLHIVCVAVTKSKCGEFRCVFLSSFI